MQLGIGCGSAMCCKEMLDVPDEYEKKNLLKTTIGQAGRSLKITCPHHGINRCELKTRLLICQAQFPGFLHAKPKQAVKERKD